METKEKNFEAEIEVFLLTKCGYRKGEIKAVRSTTSSNW